MPILKCEYCDFGTNKRSDYDRHVRTKKHYSRITDVMKYPISDTSGYLLDTKSDTMKYPDRYPEVSSPDTKKSAEKNEEFCSKGFECDFCGRKFTAKCNLYRHLKYRCKTFPDHIENKNSDEIDKVRILIKQNDNLQEQNSNLQKQINELMALANKNADVAVESSKSNHKSMSMMSFAIKNFTKAPEMKLLEGKELAGLITYESQRTLEELIIHNFESNTLDKFLGDMIIKVYKKKNPKHQSMWTTDTSRLSFIVRQLIGTTGKNEWVNDKSGIKINQLIVIPILERVKIAMVNYIEKCGKKTNIDGKNMSSIMENMYIAQRVIYSITKEYLNKDIIKYIAPAFGIDIKTLQNDADCLELESE